MARHALYQNVHLVSLIAVLFECLAKAHCIECDHKCGTIPPLISAVLRGDITSVRKLLDKSDDPNGINGSDGLALVSDECLLDALNVPDRDTKDGQIVKLLLVNGAKNGKKKGGGASIEKKIN